MFGLCGCYVSVDEKAAVRQAKMAVTEQVAIRALRTKRWVFGTVLEVSFRRRPQVKARLADSGHLSSPTAGRGRKRRTCQSGAAGLFCTETGSAASIRTRGGTSQRHGIVTTHNVRWQANIRTASETPADLPTMPASQILQHLYTLGASSPEIPGLLDDLIRSDEEERYFSSLQGPELTRLVDFLDGVRSLFLF